MKLRIDTSRSYALALEGGGAKGAYQIGAWKALREAGVKIDAVAGTSVGALNGKLLHTHTRVGKRHGLEGDQHRRD